MGYQLVAFRSGKGWHAVRRGLATNLHDLGVDDKTIEARHKERERLKPKPIETPVKDSEGRIVSSITVWHSVHASMPAEMITDPWTGQPKVFTEEEKAEFELANRGWTPEWRERIASFECNICHRLFREHSAQELVDCRGRKC